MLYTDDPSADEKIREDCVPGTPHITFYNQPGVSIDVVNLQPHSGLFEVRLSIIEGDTVAKLASRLVKHHKQIKGTSALAENPKCFCNDENDELYLFIF